jgi:hypothetical protein
VVQQWDMDTALFNYCPATAARDLDHLDDDDKRQLLVKLREDADTVISKTEGLLNAALHEAAEK